jgi:hypothetical protein
MEFPTAFELGKKFFGGTLFLLNFANLIGMPFARNS